MNGRTDDAVCYFSDTSSTKIHALCRAGMPGRTGADILRDDFQKSRLHAGESCVEMSHYDALVAGIDSILYVCDFLEGLPIL